MTEEELDLLASAVVDGEAGSEELAMVERDPQLAAQLQARVDTLRTVSGLLRTDVPGPPPGLKDRQIGAALAAYTTATGQPELKEAEVLDMRAMRQARATSDSMNQVRRLRVGGMPQWLPAAAVFLLIGGGLIFLVGTNGSNDTETADAGSASQTDDAADASVVAEADTRNAEAAELGQAEGDADAMQALPEESFAAEAADEEAAGEDAEASDEAVEEADRDDGGAATTTTGPAQTQTTPRPADGFFPEEPVLLYSSVPDPEDVLTELPDLFDPDGSRCGPGLELEPEAELAGYLPVQVAEEPVELFVTVDQAGRETAVLVSVNTCQPIE